MMTPVPSPEKWVFVVGCYNSGTTLISEVLASHSEISALPSEGQYLTDQLPSDHELGLSRMWIARPDIYRMEEGDQRVDVARLKKEWGSRLDRRKRVFLEKTPANAARTRWLQENFQNAYFIGVLRNGYAVAEGISRKAKPTHLPGGWPIRASSLQWRLSNEILEKDARHLARFMWVRYEDFVRDTSTELTKILDFLGIKGASGIDLAASWSIHERNEKIRDLNGDSITRLTPHDIRVINEVAGEALEHFGYPIIEPTQ